MTSGTTCTVIFVNGLKLYIAHVGDSRAVIANNVNGVLKAMNLTRDHKPDLPDEEARIIEWGGFVQHPLEEGLSGRVYLDEEHTMIGLAMSRSIGDCAVKAVGVIAEPECNEFTITSSSKFIILASDGVWEFIYSQVHIFILCYLIAICSLNS
jgi:serine/threonine protein phosphatase PrpC